MGFKGFSLKVYLYIAGGILILALILLWLMFSGTSPMEVALDSGVKAKFTATFKNSEINREKDGKLLWNFKVDEVANDQTTNKLLLRGIKGKIYRDDGSYYDVTAKEGEMRDGSQDFMVKNDVMAVLSSDGSKLQADKVVWQDKKKLITATGKVQIWHKDWYGRGDKAITDSSFKKMRLIGHAYIERNGKE